MIMTTCSVVSTVLTVIATVGKQSVSLREKDFKLRCINHTDCFPAVAMTKHMVVMTSKDGRNDKVKNVKIDKKTFYSSKNPSIHYL